MLATGYILTIKKQPQKGDKNMPSVKIIHCADLHIGATESFLSAKSQSRRQETLITFEKIMEAAVKSETDIVLIAGDLLDSNAIESGFFDRIIAAVKCAQNVKVVFAAGNHDPLCADSPFLSCDKPKNLFILPTEYSYFEFPELKTRVYGKSFGSIYEKGVSVFPLDTDSEFINIMCLHGDLRSDLNSDYNSVTESFISNSGMDYIALGHIHKRSEIQKAGHTRYAYSGCAEGQGFDELGEKGVYIGEVSKADIGLKFLPTSKRLHILQKTDVSGISNSQKICDEIISTLYNLYGESATENLYKIVLTGKITDDVNISVAEIETLLNEKLYFAKVRNCTEPYIDYAELRKEKTLKGIFVNNMLNRIENADEGEKELLCKALYLGINAFKSEVSFDEN